MPTFSSSIQYSFGILNQSNKTRARNKRESNKEGRRQVIPICRWHDPLPKRPKNFTKKFLEIINTFGKVARYKINIQKSVAFLYTNNEQTEKEIREIISFIIASKNYKITWKLFFFWNKKALSFFTQSTHYFPFNTMYCIKFRKFFFT
jgi:hypothetical protein